jgi:NAD(P)-dependent dehydrogenase (short-subunit alcohol dehydrogenase family)
MQFNGKTVIVTGAGQGIGHAIATVFSERGANIVANGRTKSKLDSLVEEIEGRGAGIAIVVGDVARRDDCKATVAAAVERFGGVDVLVNNAQAAAADVRVIDIDDAALDLTFGNGARGTLYMMQACHPVMKQRGGGCIVNMGSSTAITGDPKFGAYVMTKEAIRGLTSVAAREWGQDNIRVNVVCPAALSPGAVEFSERHPEAYASMLKTVRAAAWATSSAISRAISRARSPRWPART